MLFHQIQVGGYDHNFSYIVGDEKSQKGMLIDPINADLLLPTIKKQGLKILLLAATHGHFDHAGELAIFYKKLDPKPTLVIHSSLKEKWKIEGGNHLLIGHRQFIKVGGLNIEVIPTPGHEGGSICFLASGKLMTGDTLFIDGCGRTDLPGSDVHQLYNSLYKVIKTLPDETRIYPGHDYGPSSSDSLGHQKKTNPYLKCGSEEDFIQLRRPHE